MRAVPRCPRTQFAEHRLVCSRVEWQRGAKDRLVLQDENAAAAAAAARSDGGAVRRLNTLGGFYRLPDGATVALVPARHTSSSLYSANSTSTTSNNKSSSASKYGNASCD